MTAETTSLAGARAARGSHSPGPQGHTQGPEMLLAPGKASPSGDRAGDRPTPGSGLNRVTAEQSHSSGTARCNLEINKNPTTFQSFRIQESGHNTKRGKPRHGRHASPSTRRAILNCRGKGGMQEGLCVPGQPCLVREGLSQRGCVSWEHPACRKGAAGRASPATDVSKGKVGG